MLCFSGIWIASSSSSFATFLLLNLMALLCSLSGCRYFILSPLLFSSSSSSPSKQHNSAPFLDAGSLFPFLQPPHPFLEMFGLCFHGCLWSTRNMGIYSPNMSIRCLGSKCVNTQVDCVDTTGIVFKLGFWDSDLVSTPQGTVSTPQADCVNTQADCVDTTDYCFRTCFWDSHLVLTPQT
ncbi:hypothetical protein Taro_018740 [Colocasia esculenta]|uniref:Uncharacterized protein n=1 Tax=Colocasia esculenta TaxID=4460 RepID=A0A843V015_COLES|nr:hypothetical protein [Colocasia esculenta]